jgi:hypothetical protein
MLTPDNSFITGPQVQPPLSAGADHIQTPPGNVTVIQRRTCRVFDPPSHWQIIKGVTPMIRRTLLAMTAATAFAMPSWAGGMKDAVDTAVEAGTFTTLVAAVEAAGLVETLKGPGPFTIFAPTDAAFAALPAGTVEDLLKPENKEQRER